MTEEAYVAKPSKPCGMFVHSCYVDDLPGGGDAVVVKVHKHRPDGTVSAELDIIDKPKRSFWLTKKAHQTHKEKKESEYVQFLDRYDVENSRLELEIFRAMKGYLPNRKPRLKELCESPFLYGADIPIETLVKRRYKDTFERSGYRAQNVTTGFFDIESSVGENFGEITMITATAENKVYTTVQRKAFYKEIPGGKVVPGNIEEFSAFAKEILDTVIGDILKGKDFVKLGIKNTFEYEYYVGDSEADIIKWIMSKIHGSRVDFMGVWNINFDVPAVMNAAKRADIKLEDLFCPPELAPEYRRVWYQEDKKQADHPTKKWHWLHTTGYTQWYDAMCVYSNLRTVIGKETSYSLDYILKKNGVAGKLTFKDGVETRRMSGIDWHRHMQKHEPYKYLVYNMFDCISLQLMEWKNRDSLAMFMLSDNTSLSKYTRQTRKACDTLYFDWLQEGRVLATTGATMVGPYDHLMFSTGGAVLRPERMDGAGLKIFSDAPEIETALTSHNCDVDFAQMYPTVGIAGNISKETKKSTCVGIYGPSVEKHFDHPGKAAETYFGMLVSPTENAVFIGNMFFGLPGYKDMEVLFAEHVKNHPRMDVIDAQPETQMAA